MLTSSFSFNV